MAVQKTMLERARLYQRKENRLVMNDEQVELALAWMRGEVSMAGTVAGFGMSHCKSYVRLAYALRQAYKSGKLKENAA